MLLIDSTTNTRFEYSSGKTPDAASSDIKDSENVQPNVNAGSANKSDLEGDATQDISKFVRVSAPASRSPRPPPALSTVKENVKAETNVAPTPNSAGITTTTATTMTTVVPPPLMSLPTPIKNSIASLPALAFHPPKKVRYYNCEASSQILAIGDITCCFAPRASPRKWYRKTQR